MRAQKTSTVKSSARVTAREFSLGRGDTRGLSLIEVLVALTVFSVSVLGLAKVGLTTSQSLRHGRGYMDEWTIAQTKLDSLKALGWEALEDEAGTDGVDGKEYNWSVHGENLRRIVLTIPRRVGGRVVVDTFSTYVAKP